MIVYLLCLSCLVLFFVGHTSCVVMFYIGHAFWSLGFGVLRPYLLPGNLFGLLVTGQVPLWPTSCAGWLPTQSG